MTNLRLLINSFCPALEFQWCEEASLSLSKGGSRQKLIWQFPPRFPRLINSMIFWEGECWFWMDLTCLRKQFNLQRVARTAKTIFTEHCGGEINIVLSAFSKLLCRVRKMTTMTLSENNKALNELLDPKKLALKQKFWKHFYNTAAKLFLLEEIFHIASYLKPCCSFQFFLSNISSCLWVKLA